MCLTLYLAYGIPRPGGGGFPAECNYQARQGPNEYMNPPVLLTRGLWRIGNMVLWYALV